MRAFPQHLPGRFNYFVSNKVRPAGPDQEGEKHPRKTFKYYTQTTN